MPKRSRKPDAAQNALRVVEQATGAPLSRKSLISQVMSEMGKKGGKIGGKLRAAGMSQQERSQAASKWMRQKL